MSDLPAVGDDAGLNSGRRPPKLLLVGWDGATPELLQRFVAAGKLPTVERLIKAGSYRPLRSTIPPVTACAWCTFLSGRNPGQHGLFDFVTPNKGSYRFDYTNGGNRQDRNNDLPAMLNRAGLRVGCVNVPMTYPPRQIDGFMISGLDAPDEKAGIATPAELFERAQAKVGDYRIDNRHLGHMKTNADRAEALAEFKRIESLRTDVTLAMMEEDPVDVLAIVYNATDQVQHHFWHLMDESHPQHPGRDSEEVMSFSGAIEDIYAHCDRELARLVERFPEANVMLMSDHGAGPTSGPRVRLNNALSQAGLLTWAKAKGGLKNDLIAGLDGFLRRTLTAKQKAMLVRLMPGGRTAIESMSLPSVDWARTVAFVYEGFTLSPCVWINRKSLFPEGIVGDGQEYDQACERVISALTDLKDPSTGEQVIPRVYRSSEVYDGPQQPYAPDLILDWWEGTTFTMTKSHPKHDGEPTVIHPDPVAVAGRDITGIHRRNGVLVAAGPQLAELGNGSHSPADLGDIAPTTLKLLGLSIASDIDGQVIDDIVAGRIEAGQRVDASVAAGVDEVDSEDAGYSDEEREMIQQRLSGLGYIE